MKVFLGGIYFCCGRKGVIIKNAESYKSASINALATQNKMEEELNDVEWGGCTYRSPWLQIVDVLEKC